MSNTEEMLRKSIEDKCGLGGLLRFNALFTGNFETADGSPDLDSIGAAVSGAFPADQAAAIMDAFSRKLEPGKSRAKSPANAGAASAGGESKEAQEAFARYFNADASQVRDIVNEARRMRAAMGKSMESHWAPHADKPVVSPAPETVAPAEAVLEEKVTEIRSAVAERAKTREAAPPQPVKAPPRPVQQAMPRPAVAAPGTQSDLDSEIRAFAYTRTACTSIDIMDFIRDLKDKGYSLQECIVLEKIYVTIEDRKKEARFAIEKEIEGLVDSMQAPQEPDIKGLLGRLSGAGLVFEEEDVRRMIRGALLRRVSLMRRD